MHPKFTIIIATFNSERTIDRCLASIAGQSYDSYETIIIDGKSKDRTVKIVDTFRASAHVSNVISEPDSGIYDAWNKGISLAKGEWILFRGSDDYFLTEKILEIMSSLVDNNIKHCQLIGGQVLFVNSQHIPMEATNFQKSDIRESLALGNMPPHPSLFHHRSLFNIRTPPFNTNFKIVGDYEFLAFSSSKTEIQCTFMPIIFTVMTTGGISGKNRLKTIEEAARARKSVHWPKYPQPVLFSTFRAVRGHVLSSVISFLLGKNIAMRYKSSRERRHALGKNPLNDRFYPFFDEAYVKSLAQSHSKDGAS